MGGICISILCEQQHTSRDASRLSSSWSTLNHLVLKVYIRMCIAVINRIHHFLRKMISYVQFAGMPRPLGCIVWQTNAVLDAGQGVFCVWTRVYIYQHVILCMPALCSTCLTLMVVFRIREHLAHLQRDYGLKS